jgi:glycosyltransferase involved in cell wall biosynthesis
VAQDAAPLVSVVLPTYNRMPYLRQAVESVLGQSEPSWELIIADDDSRDGTQQYVSGLSDERIRYLRLSHLGHPGKVRNAALPRARGRYIAFLDSDDWWEPDKLSLQLAALRQRPECGWSYTFFRSVDQSGADLASRYQPLPLEGLIGEALLSGAALVITPSVMVERALLAGIGGFDGSLAAGSHLDLFVRLALRSSVALVPRVLVIRRTHADNYGRPFRDSMPDIERLFQRLAAHAPSPKARRMVMERRKTWLVDAANRQRVERQFRAAWNSLRAALPGAAMSGDWWKSVAKTAIRMLLPAGGAGGRVKSVNGE